MNKIKLQIAIEENRLSLAELEEQSVKEKINLNYGGIYTDLKIIYS